MLPGSHVVHPRYFHEYNQVACAGKAFHAFFKG